MKVKKILSLALAAVMVFSMSTVSFAADSTNSTLVKYGVEEIYEVNIPAEIVLDAEGVGEATISIGEDFLISTGSVLEVFVSGDDYVDKWELIDEEDGANKLTYTINDTIVNNDLVLSVESGHDVVANPVSSVLEFEVTDKLSKSGNYQDTLTFTVSISRELKQDENGNYLVSSAADLFTLSKKVNSGEFEGESISVLMTKNIDLNNRPFTPIGTTTNNSGDAGYFFEGTFDGQGYTISNLNVSATDAATNDNSTAGLFGIVYKSRIERVNIDTANITGTHFAGALVGAVKDGPTVYDYSHINDCHVVGAVVTSNYYNSENSGDKAGALVGALNSNYMDGCTAENSTVTASRDAGQVVGSAFESRVTDCTANNVTVTWNGEGANTNIRNEVIGRLLVTS